MKVVINEGGKFRIIEAFSLEEYVGALHGSVRLEDLRIFLLSQRMKWQGEKIKRAQRIGTIETVGAHLRNPTPQITETVFETLAEFTGDPILKQLLE